MVWQSDTVPSRVRGILFEFGDPKGKEDGNASNVILERGQNDGSTPHIPGPPKVGKTKKLGNIIAINSKHSQIDNYSTYFWGSQLNLKPRTGVASAEPGPSKPEIAKRDSEINRRAWRRSQK